MSAVKRLGIVAPSAQAWIWPEVPMRKSAANMRDWRLFGLPATGSTGDSATKACRSFVVKSPGASAELKSPFSQSSNWARLSSRLPASKVTSMSAPGMRKRSSVEPVE